MIYTTLSYLTDEELLRHVEMGTSIRSFLSTDAERERERERELERELAARFANLLDERSANAERLEVLDKYELNKAADLEKRLSIFDEFDLLDIRSLLEAITTAGFDTAEALNARLAIADQFDSIANDAGDLFTRLNTLIATTQE